MTGSLTFEFGPFRSSTDREFQLGRDAATGLQNGVSTDLSTPSATSPAGNIAATYTSYMQTALSPAGTALSTGASDLNNTTLSGLSAIENQDNQNAAGFPQTGATPSATPETGGQDLLNPESIDKEAQDKAEQMLGGDQMTQMMTQMLGMGVQAGAQIAQQVSQQLSQITSKLGEVVGQAGQQVGQLAGKFAETATKQAADAATPDMGALDPGLGSAPAGGLPGGSGPGGGAEPGTTVPAGMETPVSPMTTSSALQASPLQPPGTGTPVASTMRGMPMMPMMPMHPTQGNSGNTTKRDPAVFPDGKLYEPPTGVEQAYGADPEIELDQPPFGETSH